MGMDVVLEQVMGPAIDLTSNVDDMFFLTAGIDKAIEGGGGTEVTDKWRKAIVDRIQSMLRDIVVSGTDSALKLCGMKDLVAAVRESGVAVADRGAVKAAIEKFNSSLSSPLVPNYEEIFEVSLRTQARKETEREIVEAYATVHRAISTSTGGDYSDAHSWLLYSPEDVKSLIM